MGSEGRSELFSSIRFSSTSPRSKDHGHSFAVRKTLHHMRWYDTCAAAMTDDLNSSASTSASSVSERITLSSKDAGQRSSSDATFQISS